MVIESCGGLWRVVEDAEGFGGLWGVGGGCGGILRFM